MNDVADGSTVEYVSEVCLGCKNLFFKFCGSSGGVHGTVLCFNGSMTIFDFNSVVLQIRPTQIYCDYKNIK